MTRNLFAVPPVVDRLQLEVSTGCNLTCVGCQRTIGMKEGSWKNSHMKLDRMQAILANAPPARVLVLQGIGEPTLNPQIAEMVDAAKATGKYPIISFNTNALVRDLDFYVDLRGRGLNHLSVSVDSLNAGTAEALRGGTDVARLEAMIRELEKLFPNMTLSIVLSRRNLPELPDLLMRLRGIGARFIEVQPLISYAATSDPICLDDADQKRARAILEAARIQFPDLILMPAAGLTPNGSRCRRPFRAVYVTVAGYLTPCCTTNDIEHFGRTSLVDTRFEDAWHNPAVAAWMQGFFDADPPMCQGCSFNPAGASPARPSLAAGIALHEKGDLAGAEAAYRTALEAGDAADALQRLGVIAMGREDLPAAIRLLEAARTLSPEPRIANNSAFALARGGRRAEAIAILVETIRANPEYIGAYHALAAHYAADGDRQQAANTLGALLERAIKVRHSDQVRHAVTGLEQLGALPQSFLYLTNILRLAGWGDEARRLCDIRLKIAPDDLAARLTRVMSHLPIVYADENEITASREAYGEELAEVAAHAALASQEELAAAFEVIGKAKPFYLSYQGKDDRPLQALFGQIMAQIARAAGIGAAWTQEPAPQARLRIGFATAYFTLHSVSKLFAGWLANLDRSRFEIFAYQFSEGDDAMSQHIMAHCDGVRRGKASVRSWAERIAEDRLDALIYLELGMDSLAPALAATRLAPVQAVTWGHPVTTGLPTMDYFLSSDMMEPPDGARHYSETLVRLPNLSIFYSPLPSDGGKLVRAALGLRETATVYGCCQSLFKYLPRHDDVFAQIAARVPDSQFIFIADPVHPATSVFRQRLETTFRQAGLDPARHLVFTPPVNPDVFPSFLRLTDAFLDSIEWSGGNTTLEALTCNLPVVTLPTALMRGRHSTAILRRIGLDDFVASTKAGYVDLAAGLADKALNASVRARIDAGKARLFGDLLPVRALETFLFEAIARAYAPQEEVGLPLEATAA